MDQGPRSWGWLIATGTLTLVLAGLGMSRVVTGADHLDVGVTTALKYFSSTPPAAGGDNYSGPEQSAAGQAEFTLQLGMAVSANASALARIKIESASGEPAVVTVERLYLNIRNAFGVRGLDLRPGRDAVTLGPIGLLLDEESYEDGRRDGLQVWLPEWGPLRVYLFAQWALDDMSTSRWLAGGRAELAIMPGWTLGANLRSDMAGVADAGACPGVDCNSGGGFGVDLEGQVIRGATLTLAYAAYTQTSDLTRAHWQANLVLELERLIGLRRFEPVVTLWYKNFDAYTIPGGSGGAAPRGGFGTPDDFVLFNINDNLTAFGGKLELELPRRVEFFILGEFGAYKGGGPSYSILSVGLAHSLAQNVEIKVAYNKYAVAGGSVVTGPVALIELADVGLWQLSFEGTW
jgi:hypothetical protein